MGGGGGGRAVRTTGKKPAWHSVYSVVIAIKQLFLPAGHEYTLPEICCIYFTIVGTVVHKIHNIVAVSVLLANVALAVVV
jgi:hypothetical protein